MKIRYSRTALRQLDDIYTSIETNNGPAANRIKTRIRRALDRLEQFPYSARATEHPGVRVLVVTRASYLVFYTVDEKAQEVHILRIRHDARGPAKHLD